MEPMVNTDGKSRLTPMIKSWAFINGAATPASSRNFLGIRPPDLARVSNPMVLGPVWRANSNAMALLRSQLTKVENPKTVS